MIWRIRRIITIVAFICFLSAGSFCASAMTVKAGQPIRIKEEPNGSIVPTYHCYECGHEFDTPADAEENGDDYSRIYTVCPNCGSEAYTTTPSAGQFVGTFLDSVYLYKENPEKMNYPPCLKAYSVDYNTYSFSCSIVINKPGKYFLEYLYTTFYEVGDAQSRDYSTLNVLGQVLFNPGKGKLDIKSSSKWIKQNSKIGKLPKPKRKGYKFLGWYSKKKGGKKIRKNTKVTFRKATVAYYAHWKKKKKKNK